MGSRLSKFLYTALVMFLLWLLLTSSFNVQELVAGAVIAILVAAFTHERFTKKGLANLHPKRVVCMFIYFFYFFWQMIKANIDVAWRVIHPKMPINPGIVHVKTKMKSDFGKLMVANSITLTPGTLTLEVLGDDMLIHWIDVKATDVETASKMIPGVFEKCLKEFME